MNVLRALVRKDLRMFLADRRSVVIGFVLPIALASFFGFLFGDRSSAQGPPRVKIGLVVEDEGERGRKLAAALEADPALDVRRGTVAEARDRVARGKVVAAVVVPRGFADRERPELVLLVDPSQAIEGQLVQGQLTRTIARTLFGVPTEAPPPFTLRTEEVTAGEGARYNAYAHSFAGMGIQFMLMTSLEAGVAILVQRQRGLWKRLRAAPLSRTMLLGSRALSGTLISLMVLGALFAFGALVFKVTIAGSFAGFLGVCVASAFMSSCFGLLIAAIGKTPEATRAMSIFVILIVVMLGGAWVPSFLFPPWLQQAAMVTPAKWAVDGLDAMMWRGLGLEAALLPIAALVGFGLLFGALAVARFRWEE